MNPDAEKTIPGTHCKFVFRADKDKLLETKRLKLFCVATINNLGMRALGDPVIYEIELELKKLDVEPFEDEGGTTAMITLTTSHITARLFPLRNLGVVDVFSCREYDPDKVVERIKAVYLTDEVEWSDLSFSLQPQRKSTQTIVVARSIVYRALSTLQHLQPTLDITRLLREELFGSQSRGEGD